jgi:threonine/homoserine/homoserine lactone efflux protein
MSEAFIAELPALLLVYAAFMLAVASPGPSTLAIMGASMAHGRQAGMRLALGVSSGSLTWGILAAVGVSTLLAGHAGMLFFIKIAGGLYLLYLAWRSARSAARSDIATSVAPASRRRIWLRGYLMHLTNPKAILSWTAIIALGLRPDAPQWVVFAIVGGCLVISLTINLGYAFLFSTDAMIAGYRRMRRWAEGALAIFFTFAGFKLLTSRL